jgi:phosphonate transport system permease protein
VTVPDLQLETKEQVRPKEPVSPKVIRWVVVAAILIPYLWSVAGLDLSISRLLEAPGQVLKLVTGLFPPDFTDSGRIITKLLESIYIAWIGTVIGAVFSFPLGFAAATNVTPRWVAGPVRAVLSGIRAFPELILAVIFIVPYGLGAFTGAIALGIHSVGTLGKLSSEVIEGIDEGPREAIQAAGGNLYDEIRYGIIPQAMPTIVSYWLYRFEINVRASAVLGLVGAGGIGAEIVARLRFPGDWPQAGAALIATVVVVLLIDAASAAVRRRIISGQPSDSALRWSAGIILGSGIDPPIPGEQQA